MAERRPKPSMTTPESHRPYTVYGKEEGLTELDWNEQQNTYLFALTGSATLGIVLAITANEMLWHHTHSQERLLLVFVQVIEFCACITTIVAFFSLYKYYDAMIKVQRAQGAALSPGVTPESLSQSRLLGWFVFDVVILLPQVMVDNILVRGEEVAYDINVILLSLMFLRMALLPRVIASMSVLRSEDGHRAARFYDGSVDTWMVMRWLLFSDLKTLIAFVVSGVLVSSYLLLLFERPWNDMHVSQGISGLDDLQDCMWVVAMTVATVGFGDVAPHTKLGRVVVGIMSLSSVIIVGVTFNLIVNNVQLHAQEANLLDFVRRGRGQKKIRARAASLMQTCWRQYKLNQRAYIAGRRNVPVKHHPTVRNALMEFRYSVRAARQLDGVGQRSGLVKVVRDLQCSIAALERGVVMFHEQTVGAGGGKDKGSGGGERKD